LARRTKIASLHCPVGVSHDAQDGQLLPLVLEGLEVGAGLVKHMGAAGFIQGGRVLWSN